ncbi:MAG: hypothetical protein IT372_17560 [Polyangiaceae bacterium]|nr:hypothetical protein [Polyangiaceae bacterium]
MKTSLLLLLALLLLACGKDGAPTPAAGATGVDACDAYVARLEACARKAPADSRPAHDASIAAARDVFELKARDGDKVALADACKQMADALAERPACN